MDLDTGAVVAAEMHLADRDDTATLPDTLESAARHLAAVDAAPSAETPAEMVVDKILFLLCHNLLTLKCCFCRQQGQRGRRWTRPTARRRRMLAIECGTCRSGRTGAARLEALG